MASLHPILLTETPRAQRPSGLTLDCAFEKAPDFTSISETQVLFKGCGVIKVKVGVVVVTWNKKDYVLRILDSLAKVSHPQKEVTVIDNASIDGTVNAIRERFPDVRIIENCENIGGTGGFNTGIQYYLQRPDINFLWLLDNDVIVSSDALNKLIEVLVSDERIAVAGSAMYDATKPENLIEIGNMMTLTAGRIWGCQRFAKNHQVRASFYFVDSVSACSMCVRKSAISEVGIWDRNFFLYFDDVDWNVRFRAHGYRIAAVPTSKIWHMPWEFKPGFVTTYYATRNVLYLMAKHVHGFKRLGILLKESKFLKDSAFALRNDPFSAVVLIVAMNDFLSHKHGRYRGMDQQELQAAINKAPCHQWAIYLSRFICLHVIRLLQFVPFHLKRAIHVLAKAIFVQLREGTRIRITQWVTGNKIVRGWECMTPN